MLKSQAKAPARPIFISSTKDISSGSSSIIRGELIWISGPPGSGKTTLVLELSNMDPTAKFLYVTARQHMLDYIESMNQSRQNIKTTLSNKFVLQMLLEQLEYNQNRLSPYPPTIKEIKEFLSLPDDTAIYQSISTIVFHVIKRFVMRMDSSIGPQLMTEEMERDLRKIGMPTEKILNYAQDLWAAVEMKDNSKTKIKIWPDAATKICQLRKTVPSNYDWIFVDDVDEFKPSLIALFGKMRQSRLIVTEGIYPFNSSSSIFNIYPVTRRMILTRSYTLGQNIATVANVLVRTFLQGPMDIESGISTPGEVYPPASPPKVVALKQSLACIGSMKDLLLFGFKVYEILSNSKESMSSSFATPTSKKCLLFSDPKEMQKYAKIVIDGFDLYVKSEETSLKDTIKMPELLSSFSDYGQLMKLVQSGDRRYDPIADFTRSYRNILTSFADSLNLQQKAGSSSKSKSESEYVKDRDDSSKVKETLQTPNSSPDPEQLLKLVNGWKQQMMLFVNSVAEFSSPEGIMDPDDELILLTTPGFTRGVSFDHVLLLEDFCDVFKSKKRLQERPPLNTLHSLYLSITRARKSLYLNTEMYQLIKASPDTSKVLTQIPNMHNNIKVATSSSASSSTSTSHTSPSSMLHYNEDDRELGSLLQTSI